MTKANKTELNNLPTGAIRYTMKNDYMFRAVMQKNENALKGQDYIDVHTTIHIGILDFNLPDLTPDFYSEYKMMNVKNHEIYSDKFVLRVLNLRAIDDKRYTKVHIKHVTEYNNYERMCLYE